MYHLLRQATDTAENGDATEPAEAATTEIDVACGNQGPFCEVLLEWTDNELVAEGISWVVGVPIKTLVIAVSAVVLNRIMRRLIDRAMDKLAIATEEYGEDYVTDRSVERAEERAETIGSLLRSLSTALVYGAATIMMLEAVGISLIPVIASAGVLSLAIGFGAQSVVEDLLRGLFMLAEDQFGVGDRIDVGSVNGYVERVTLRTTVIRDNNGTLWHVPNSEISRVANENQLSSRASILIGVSYAADLEEAMSVLARAAEEAAGGPDWKEHISRPPEVPWIHELGDDAVNICVVVWVAASERRRFERHLRLRLKEALDIAGIEMPNRQLDVWLRGQTQAA
ncbi:MAG: mechanosensitive ion channel family protein [Acidimicrobiia bacterium]|nr:mechanosensitive ion channel family protein [Acidimicrobiia bacterium]